MKIGLVGLGKMGYNLALNMLNNNIDVVAYDKYFVKINDSEESGIIIKNSLKELVDSLEKPRVVWLMVPAGDIVEGVIKEVSELLEKNDVLIDGGNSMYLDTIRRHTYLLEKGIHFIDVGTSGGTLGARNGACLMVGGNENIVSSIDLLFKKIAQKDGYAYMGKSGSGHYVKMVHNGIEYGMMQAIGEGFDLLNSSRFELDYENVAKVWANGSIIEGLLMRTVLSAVSRDPKLENIQGIVDDSGEGQWTIEEALRQKVSIPVIAQSLFARYKSKDELHFSEKIVAAMRNEFGGHAVYKK